MACKYFPISPRLPAVCYLGPGAALSNLPGSEKINGKRFRLTQNFRAGLSNGHFFSFYLIQRGCSYLPPGPCTPPLGLLGCHKKSSCRERGSGVGKGKVREGGPPPVGVSTRSRHGWRACWRAGWQKQSPRRRTAPTSRGGC